MSQEKFEPNYEGEANKEGEIAVDPKEIKVIPCQPDELFSTDDVKRLDVEHFGDEGFLLSNVMTKAECEHYITQGERLGFERIRGVSDDIRNSQR